MDVYSQLECEKKSSTFANKIIQKYSQHKNCANKCTHLLK